MLTEIEKQSVEVLIVQMISEKLRLNLNEREKNVALETTSLIPDCLI